jgi:hypothetical protein
LNEEAQPVWPNDLKQVNVGTKGANSPIRAAILFS